MIDLDFYTLNIEKAIIGKEIKLVDIESDWLSEILSFDRINNGLRPVSKFPYLNGIHTIGLTKKENLIVIRVKEPFRGAIYYLNEGLKIFHLIDEDYDWLTSIK